MATADTSATAKWAVETRQAIGRPRRGAETRTEQTALPDKEQLAIASRLTNLKDKIDELALVAPASAMGVVQTKYELLKRSLLGGNAATMETPLSQLESTVAQLLVQSKPKPVASGPQRRAPPPPPTPTPVPQPSPPPRPAASGPGAGLPTELKDGLERVEPKIDALIPDGGAPADALKVEFEAIKAATADAAKHAESLTKLKALEPRVNALKVATEAARLAAAKVKINALSTAPADKTSFTPVDTRAKAAVAAKTMELSALLKAGSENQDQDIHRKVALGLTQSSDKSYIDNVQKPCDAALKAVADAIAAKKPVKPAITKRLEILLVQLDEQRAHYADKTGVTDRAMIAQRDAKVAAIDKRKAALSAAIAKVAEIAKVPETEEAGARNDRRAQLKTDGTHAAVMKLAENLQNMKATDAVAAKKSAKELQTYLSKADPVTRQVLFQDMQSKDAIADILAETDTASADAIVADIIKAKSGTPAFLDELSADLIQSEIRPLDPVAGRGTALRSNSMASKLSGQCNKTSPSGQAFINQATKPALKAITATTGDLEVDPTKITGLSEPKKQQAIAERTAKHKALAREAVDGVTKTPVPPDVAKICATIYEEAMAKFKTPTGEGDEKQAMILVGGHMMLRLVTPGLTAALEDPSLTEDQRKAITLQMKLLQNMSNNVAPGGAKEAHMNGFADLVKTGDGGPSPEVQKLQAYMKSAVVEGKAAKFDWGNVDAILNNDRARGILMEYVKGEYSDENLLFWQEVRGGAPANPQLVYDTYISASAAKQVNLPAPKRKPFDDINAVTPKNWAAAPWLAAKTEIAEMIKTDTLRRFKASPKAMDAARAAVA